MNTKVAIALIGAAGAIAVALIGTFARSQTTTPPKDAPAATAATAPKEAPPDAARQPEPAPQPLLIAAEFWTHTNDDNKDHDTGIYVYITTADGQTTLAQIENADNSADDATEYNDRSDHSLRLTVTAPGVPKDSCKGFKVTVKQRTNGNDTWKFNARATLRFSDQTTLQAARDGIELKNDGAQASF